MMLAAGYFLGMAVGWLIWGRKLRQMKRDLQYVKLRFGQIRQFIDKNKR